jgi:chromate transport protein ChrA
MTPRRPLLALSAAPLPAMALMLLALWFLSTRSLSGAFWQALAAVAAVAIPLAMHGLYEAAIAKTLRRERYQRDGRFFRLFAGRLLLGAVALLLVLLAAPFVVVRLHVLDAREWTLLASYSPVSSACCSTNTNRGC